MFKGFPIWVREVLFLLFTLMIWCNWSLVPLVQNRPESFQAAGSIIVASAIAIWGFDRAKRERKLAQAEKDAIVATLNTQEAKIALHECISLNTANMKSLEYLKLLDKLGLHGTGFEDQREVIRELEHSLVQKTETNSAYETLNQAIRTQNQCISICDALSGDEQTRWVTLLRRVELWFVVLGTLQWGYGDIWVSMLHEFIGKY